MTPAEFQSLENIEFDACIDLYNAAPGEVRALHDIAVTRIGSVACLTCRGVEPALVFRRAVGLGLERPATEAELDKVLFHMQQPGLSYAIPVAPQYAPATLAAWLEQRNFSPGYAWMKFHRQCDDLPSAACDLDIRVVSEDFGVEFARIVATAFELPETTVPWIGALPGRPNWVCVMAFSGGIPVATGAAYVAGDYAWLGFGATLKSYRRQGAQNALLVRRLREAKARGAKVAVTETGQQQPGKPDNSYRNILRAGFAEAYLRQNYLSPPHD